MHAHTRTHDCHKTLMHDWMHLYGGMCVCVYACVSVCVCLFKELCVCVCVCERDWMHLCEGTRNAPDVVNSIYGTE
jgi:hypothetical protein